MDRGRIETIHAFCSALLRMHPLEAGLLPDFEALADLAGDLDVTERFRRWFDSLTPGELGAEAVRQGLLLGLRPDGVLELFTALNENWDLVEEADWSVGAISAVSQAQLLGEDVQRCVDLLPHCHTPDELYQRVDALRLVATRLGEAADEDVALVALIALEQAPALGRSGNQRNWDAVDGVNACRTIKDTFHAAVEEAKAVLGAARTAAIGGIAKELRHLVLAYAEERRQRGLVTYQDLLVRARNLLRDHPDVRAALRLAGTSSPSTSSRTPIPSRRSWPSASARPGTRRTAGGASCRRSRAGSASSGTPSSRSTASAAPTSPSMPPSSATWSGPTRGRGCGSR